MFLYVQDQAYRCDSTRKDNHNFSMARRDVQFDGPLPVPQAHNTSCKNVKTVLLFVLLEDRENIGET